jgi:hypothetical protein
MRCPRWATLGAQLDEGIESIEVVWVRQAVEKILECFPPNTAGL